MVQRYQKRLNGLLLERIDIHLVVAAEDKLMGPLEGDSSRAIRTHVAAAYQV
jgi:predicted ATPase with chaperone activity